MKTAIILKEFRALSFVKGMVAGTNAPANSGSQSQRASDSVRRFAMRQARRAEQFREMLRRRETTPLASVIPHHRWGINE